MRSIAALLLSVTMLACGDTIVNVPTAPEKKEPVTPAAPVVIKSTIEFRVFGNASSVRARYSTPADGLAQVVTALPYFTRFTTPEDRLFLSLDVTPLAYPALITAPFLNAQILVDGNLFREATSTDLLTTLTVNGTWRR